MVVRADLATRHRRSRAAELLADSQTPDAGSACIGSPCAYGCRDTEPHRGAVLWPNCWKCGSVMGCSTCVPGKKDENRQLFNDTLICKRCRVAANPETFLRGGPLSPYWVDIGGRQVLWGQARRHTPDVGEYPADWQPRYASQRARLGLPLDLPAQHGEYWAFRKQFEELIAGAEMPQGKTNKQLRAEKNRQGETK